ncbi:MAG: 50S ribosomal protein L16, partial [Halobacteriaceae archaeon]
MPEKPGSMYREISKPPYTRREYISGIPGSKIAQHNMGNLQSHPEDYPVELSLVVEEECQLRHSALEASRLTANRFLLEAVGVENYKMV